MIKLPTAVKIVCLFLFMIYGAIKMNAQNYDEGKIPGFSIPEIMVGQNGKKIENIDQWQNSRRPEILELFGRSVYGKVPLFKYQTRYQVLSIDPNALSGKATQKEVVISINNANKEIRITMLMFLPNAVKGAVPVFLGLNFYGNHLIHPSDKISVTSNYVINNEKFLINANRSTERARGLESGSWPLELILDNGYGLVTFNCGDIDEDFDDGFKNGIHPLGYGIGQDLPLSYEWGTIAAWAWGLSLAMDYFEQDQRIDEQRTALIGHSRLGKAALWAGANDERFGLVISNNSGCGGAALFRRRIGETVEAINFNFPHWFCENFKNYNGLEDELPVDQHMLIALMAPRPVYVASAQEDAWADPKGEYLSLFHAAPAYKLYGLKVLEDVELPAVNSPVMVGNTGYHIRSGAHALTKYDWVQYIKFADRYFKK